jgi:hypothetical protein
VKFSKTYTGLLLGTILLLGAAASPSNKTTLNLEDAVSIHGMHLPKGQYKVTWEGTGPDIELSFIQSHKTVATTPARVVELDHPGKHAGYGTGITENGTKSLTAIYFVGRKYDIEIGEKPAAMGAISDNGPN